MKRIIVGIICFLLIPTVAMADVLGIGISCKDKVSPGEKVTCNVSATIDTNVNGIQGNIEVSNVPKSNIKFVKNSGINCYVCDSDGFAFGETDGIFNKTNDRSFNLGSIEIDIPSTLPSGSKVNVKLSNIAFSVLEGTGEGGSIDNVDTTINVREKSSDNSLLKLFVSNYNLEPAFSPDVTSYKVKADDIEKVTIEAIRNDSHSTVTGAGEKTLKYGDNKFNIDVTSETGAVRTYTIVINRFDSRDKVNTLNNLALVGYDLDQAFDPNKTSYTATIPSDISKVKIEAERTPAEGSDKPKSTFVNKYGPREVKVDYGKHAYEIRVKAENESIKKYIINITRIDDRDPNNYLKSLNISSGKYKFNKETSNYIINVENNVGVVIFTCEGESEKAEVKCPGNVDLKVGSNKVTIKVKAENEKIREYNITINRLKEGTTIEEVENIVYLKHLSVLNKNIKFNQKTTSYDIPITKENTVTFEYELFDGINGTIELKDDPTGPIKLAKTEKSIDISPVIDGSIIYLNVESSEGYSRMYTFNVKVADYYMGDIDLPTEKEKLEIKWTWQLIVGLASLAIILVEIGFAIYVAIKKGGVENKSDMIQDSMVSSLKKIKIPKKNPFKKSKE